MKAKENALSGVTMHKGVVDKEWWGDDGDGEIFPSLAVLSVTITFVVDIYNSDSIIVTDLLR